MTCHTDPQTLSLASKIRAKDLAPVMHITRAALFSILVLLDPVSYILFAWFGFFELVVAKWLRSPRMEAWGLSMGMCCFHFLLPVASSISIIVSDGILLLCACEVVFLYLIRKEGLFNFSRLPKYEKASINQSMTIQKNVFNLIILAQFFKSISVIFGIFVVFYVEGFSSIIPWLFNAPLIPILLVFAGIDSGIILGLYSGKEWAFHITNVMAVVGFVETLFAWMPLIILISVWIIMLMLPCWAKDGFYLKFINSQK